MYLHERRHQWASQVETLKHRVQEVQSSLPELQERAGLPAATEDDKVALRTARAALGLLRRQLADLQGDYWIGVLEEHGILPNYTLLDDSVALDVTLSWIDPDTQEYMSEPATFNRGASVALRDFAPGATFYARGFKIQIDAVDLGSDGDSIMRWVFCPSCGYGQHLKQATPPASCPRCGEPAISDVNQILHVVEMERVSSAMRREEAAIDDGRDERERVRFQVVTAADVDTPRHQWFVAEYPFGLKHLTNMTIRWLNIGKATEPGSGHRLLSGEEYVAPLFRVCSGCGKLDSRTGQNTACRAQALVHVSERRKGERPASGSGQDAANRSGGHPVACGNLDWGPLRSSEPASSTPTRFARASRRSARPPGVRADHRPIPSDGTENRDAILIHDTVPGGTGYLAEWADPAKVYACSSERGRSSETAPARRRAGHPATVACRPSSTASRRSTSRGPPPSGT